MGPNGSGKSNFIDAVRFTREALVHNLDNALRERGGINEVRRRSGGHPTHFGVRLEFSLPSGNRGCYALEIGTPPRGSLEVKTEACRIVRPGGSEIGFDVNRGQARPHGDVDTLPAAALDRLFLVNASGLTPFREVYDALAGMGFHSLNPAEIRVPQPPQDNRLLELSGRNAAAVLGRMAREHPDAKHEVEEYLNRVVPSVHSLDRAAVGPLETVAFRQDVPGQNKAWRFFATNMSDGTLRTAGILIALIQDGGERKVPLIAVEEPETALHPGSARILRDALLEASASIQVLVTSHSPDILDSPDIPDESILGVNTENGTTRIGPLEAGLRSSPRDRLYTAGELLRLGQTAPDAELVDASIRQLRRFDAE